MYTKYQMWLTHDSELLKLYIPVLPETFSISSGSKDSSINVAELGEVIIKQARPAIKLSFKSFFPNEPFSGVGEWFTPPLNCVQLINYWKDSPKPIHFVLTGMDIDMYCIIEQFDYYEQGGDVGTIYYDLTLKEYREVSIRQFTVETERKPETGDIVQKAVINETQIRVDNTVQPQTYTVLAGDCLWNIAKKIYGDGSKYTVIAQANKDVIKNNMIHAGQVLKIPKL